MYHRRRRRRRKGKKRKCMCVSCSHRRRKGKSKRKAKMGRRGKVFHIRPRLKAKRRGRKVYLVDSRGRVRGSFATSRRGSMTRRAAKRRFKRFGSKRSRAADYRQTARRTYRLRSNRRNRRGQGKWFLRPNEYDIRGIDTKMGKKKTRTRKTTRKRRRRSAMGRSRSRRM